MACDFRFQKDALKGLNYSICGLGNSLYEENFNTVAIELDKSISSMQANRVAPLYLCDENTVKSRHSSLEGDVTYWQNNFFEKLDYYIHKRSQESEKINPAEESQCCQAMETNNNTVKSSCCKTNDSDSACCKDKETNGVEQNGNEPEEKYEDSTEDEEENDEENGSYFSDIDDELDDELENGGDKKNKVKKAANGLIDMEDLGKVVNNMNKKKNAVNAEPKEMITPLLRKSLEKQGYKLIGSHSGVKLCRWTKSMLRGRGGCYKHTFYGIESHRCMETTPSLACGILCFI